MRVEMVRRVSHGGAAVTGESSAKLMLFAGAAVGIYLMAKGYVMTGAIAMAAGLFGGAASEG